MDFFISCSWHWTEENLYSRTFDMCDQVMQIVYCLSYTHTSGSISGLEIAIYICEASLVLMKAEFVHSLRIIEIVAFSF